MHWFIAILVLFSPHLLQAVKESALLTFKDSLDGVVITIFPPSLPSSSSGPASNHFCMPGQQLSQECGHNFIRCQDLFMVVADDLQTVVLFIPLVRGIALVGVSQEANGGYSVEHRILPTFDDSAPATSCSPSVFFSILDGYFAVCTNKTTNFVAVFEVQLNKSSLSSSGLVPTNQLTIPAPYGNLSNASNFLHVEIDSSHEHIIFAVGRVIYSIRPFFYSAAALGEEIPSGTCDQVHTLVPIQGAEFYAYCSDYVFTYDVGEQDWIVQEAIAGLQGRGVVYPCPRPDTDISVFSDHFQINRNDLNKNVDIEGDSYSSGVCLGNSSHSYFAYMDGGTGLYVYALSIVGLEEDRIAQFPHQCGDTCYPLVAVADQYLIVRDSMKISVLDGQGNLSAALIEASYTTTPLVTVVVLERPPTRPSPGTVTPTDHTSTVHVSTTNGGHVAPRKEVSYTKSIVGGVIGMSVVGFIIAMCAVIVFLCYRRSKGMQTSSPETGRNHPDQQVAGLQATTRDDSQATEDDSHQETGGDNVNPQQASRDMDPQQASRDLNPQQASRDLDPQQASRDMDPQQANRDADLQVSSQQASRVGVVGSQQASRVGVVCSQQASRVGVVGSQQASRVGVVGSQQASRVGATGSQQASRVGAMGSQQISYAGSKESSVSTFEMKSLQHTVVIETADDSSSDNYVCTSEEDKLLPPYSFF